MCAFEWAATKPGEQENKMPKTSVAKPAATPAAPKKAKEAPKPKAAPKAAEPAAPAAEVAAPTGAAAAVSPASAAGAKHRSRSPSFRTYIQRLLKAQQANMGIGNKALMCMDSLLVFLAENFCERVHRIVNGKTVSDGDVESVVFFLFGESLGPDAVAAGAAAVKAFQDNAKNKDMLGNTKQKKANITLPVSLVERFLREFGKSKLRVTQAAAVYTTAVFEHFVNQVLQLTIVETVADKKQRIKNRHIKLAIEKSAGLKTLVNGQLKMFLPEAGVVPDIHPFLTVQRPKKRKASALGPDGKAPEGPRKHRFRPGTVSLRNIKKQQRSTELQIQHAPFIRAVKDIVQKDFGRTTGNVKLSVRFSANFFDCFQQYVEAKVVEWFRGANLIAIHAQRQTLAAKDLEMLFSVGAQQENIVPSDGEFRLSEEGIRRLSQRAGVKIVAKETLAAMKRYIRGLIVTNMRVLLQLTKHEKKFTITPQHLKQSFALRGVCAAIN